jgi:hypothetical protein
LIIYKSLEVTNCDFKIEVGTAQTESLDAVPQSFVFRGTGDLSRGSQV